VEQRQWAQKELKRTNEELRRANQDLEMFAYSSSHDLREPLQAMSLAAQLLENLCGDQLPGKGPMFLGAIRRAAERMETLLNDLLSYTTLSKTEETPPVSIESGDILVNVLESLKAVVEKTGAMITSENLPQVSAHEGRLAQVFQNLIGNALKYRSAAPPRIHVSAVERDGWFIFSVADNGIGIDPQYADQIFSPFKRLHSKDAYPGSGIGLAICQRVLEQYGGRIWLERAAPGEGSTFCFTLPAYMPLGLQMSC
jgi:light-regulated signal transduction histidine kinase (bacteriophytochrome)